MTKILITPKNSIWGVIINPQSSNTYRHALNFATPQIKEDFINKELFNAGDDYKALLAATEERSFTRLTATSAEFVVEVSEYPNETFVSLLNKDFCIIEEDGVEQFYTLSGKRNGSGNTIIYTAELDIFFTYGIKDMFNDKETEIKRGMYDRFINDANGNTIFRENYLDTPIINKESFDSDFSNLRFPETTEEISPLNVTRPEFIYEDPSDTPLTEAQKEYLWNSLKAITWQMVTMAIKPDGSIPHVTPSYFNSALPNVLRNNNTKLAKTTQFGNPIEVDLPFIQFVTPAIREDNFVEKIDLFPKPIRTTFEIIKDFSIHNANNRVAFLRPFSPEFLTHPEILKNTLTILPLNPLELFKDMRIKIKWNSYENSPNQDASNLSLSFLDTRVKDNEPEDKYVYSEYYGTFHEPNTADGLLGIRRITKVENTSTSSLSPSPKNIISLDPLTNKSQDLEPKLNFSPYSVFEVGSSTKTKSELLPENFIKNEIILRSTNSYLTSHWGYLIEFQNYGNIYQSSNPFLNPQFDYIIEDFSVYQLPTDIDSWSEYITRNRSSQTAQFVNKGLGLGLGLLGAVAAPFTGGASAAAVGVGLASLAAKSASDLNQQISQRKDIKNTPNQVTATGSTLSYDYINKGIKPYLLRKTIDPILKAQIYDHIYKYGYNFDSRLTLINNFLDTRYWFNYIEASDTFENIKLQAAADIKQLINDTLEQGITIWHVRDLNTFKGIKNYEKENTEITLVSSTRTLSKRGQ